MFPFMHRGHGDAEPGGPRRHGGGTDGLREDPPLEGALAECHRRFGVADDHRDDLGPGRPGVGFQSEVIGLVDTARGFQGRSVWTDEHGDQVFSELEGEGTAAKNRVTGTVLSGTGRYAGVTGSYEFSWQWVMEGEDGAVHGRAVDLKGRVQPGPAAGGSPR